MRTLLYGYNYSVHLCDVPVKRIRRHPNMCFDRPMRRANPPIGHPSHAA